MKNKPENYNEKILVNFRIRKHYHRTFQKACQYQGVAMSHIIESLIFKYLKEFDANLTQPQFDKELLELIGSKLNPDLKEGEIEKKE